MPSVGPALPPHLEAKRKRQREQEAQAAAAAAAAAAATESTEADESRKRRRIIGPAMPPNPESASSRTEDAPGPIRSHSPSAASSSEDDDFGPAPPSAAETQATPGDAQESAHAPSEASSAAPKLTRDEWMTMAPAADNLGRMDPARPRPRAFNTSKGARGANAGAGPADSSLWNETPEQKRVRLRNEMLGVNSAETAPPSGASLPRADSKETKTKIKQHMDQTRGPSLVDQHRERKGVAVEDDDPSRRVFDREKDMGSGVRIGSSQREQMLKKAASSVSSKFSGGGYL